nr:ARID DNA-binding domain-containing protein [Tanacetum cinerariifolium]
MKKQNEGIEKIGNRIETTKAKNEVKQDEIISQQWDTFRGRFNKVLKWFYKSYLGKPLPSRIPPKINGVQIHLFDLYKLIEGLGGYLSIYFGREFGTIGEILGLSKQGGEEVKKCYIQYLDVFTSYYKTARVPNQEHRSNLGIPTKTVEEGKEYTCPASHQCDFGESNAPNLEAANIKGKEKIKHFGVKLEEEEYHDKRHFHPIQPNKYEESTLNKGIKIKTEDASNISNGVLLRETLKDANLYNYSTVRVKLVLLVKIEENILSSYYCLYTVNAASVQVTTASSKLMLLVQVNSAERLQLLKDKDCLKIKIT